MKPFIMSVILALFSTLLYSEPVLNISQGYDFYTENAANRFELGARYAISLQSNIIMEPGLQLIYISGSSPAQAFYRAGITGCVSASIQVGSIQPYISLDLGIASLNRFYAATNLSESGLQFSARAGALWQAGERIKLGLYAGYGLFTGLTSIYNPIVGLTVLFRL